MDREIDLHAAREPLGVLSPTSLQLQEDLLILL